ncbi:LuxR C-terminal-related transcriptional regulator [Streptomyces phyllanthi]|uniref:helix-turn-helix transcriptional regulator n=1 Tax=Streptomyces phyllanthi TaxID=1803180 RepID=UPI003626DA75
MALACRVNDSTHDDWLDAYTSVSLTRVSPPYRELRTRPWHAIVLCCREPARELARLIAHVGHVVPPVLVISPAADPKQIGGAFRLGATSYLVAGDFNRSALSAAVDGTLHGHTHLSPRAASLLQQGGAEPPSAVEAAEGGEAPRRALSPRERQIMDLLANGFGAMEIGGRLSLTEKTVRNNLSNIYAKLGVRGSTEAVLLWLGITPRRGTSLG